MDGRWIYGKVERRGGYFQNAVYKLKIESNELNPNTVAVVVTSADPAVNGLYRYDGRVFRNAIGCDVGETGCEEVNGVVGFGIMLCGSRAPLQPGPVAPGFDSHRTNGSPGSNSNRTKP